MIQFKNFAHAKDYLYNQVPKTPREILGSTQRIEKNIQIAKLFGNPQNSHRVIHVAGTSGKGSICYLIDALLRAHSKRSALMISPHVYDIRERIQINGQMISEKRFTEVCAEVLTHSPSDFTATYFEILTMMGFIASSRARVEYLTVETGLGGRLDATNVIDRPDKICVITQIGFDHTEALGGTLAKIAAEKVGIITDRSTVIALRQSEEVNEVIQKRCDEQSATLVWLEPKPDYQDSNDGIAIATVQALARSESWTFQPELVKPAFEHIFIPGRFEKRALHKQLFVLDGAHNPQKLSALVSHIALSKKGTFTIILGMCLRKDLDECVKILQPIAARIIATSIDTNQKHTSRDTSAAQQISAICTANTIQCSVVEHPAEALELAAQYGEPVLATGSFYLLHAVDRALSRES